MAQREYNGLHWRTVKRHDTSVPANGLDQQTQMYYDASWRLVEERIDESYVSSPGLNRHMQNLWGARYIDDLISRRKDANRDGDYIDSTDGVFYAVTDVQFSVVAMLTSTGKLHERVAYDSYGTARHHWKDDVDGDGDVDSSDKSAVTALLNKAIYQSGYNPAADIDRSGTIDSADATLVSSKVIAALPAGEISDRAAAGPDNTIGYDGYVFNPENLLYTVRFRHYDTGLGRWLERDPAGFVASSNLLEYCKSIPTLYHDTMGAEPDTNYEMKELRREQQRNRECDTNSDSLLFDAVTAMFDWLEAQDSSWLKCMFQCAVLEMTDEDISMLLEELYNDPDIFDLMSGQGVLKTAACPGKKIAELPSLVKLIQGRGCVGGAVTKATKRAGHDVARSKVVHKVRKFLTAKFGKAASKLAGKISGAVTGLGLISLVSDACVIKDCYDACKDDVYNWNEVPFLDELYLYDVPYLGPGRPDGIPTPTAPKPCEACIPHAPDDGRPRYPRSWDHCE